METEDAKKGDSDRTIEADIQSSDSGEYKLAAEDNSNSSIDKLSSRASSQGKIEEIR